MTIERRHRTYFVSMTVPADVRGKLGKRMFRETLGTGDIATAKRRALEPLARWKLEVETARGNPGTNDAAWRARRKPRSTAGVDDDVPIDPAVWRKALREARTKAARDDVMEAMQACLLHVGMPGDPAANEYFGQATSVGTLAYADEYLRSLSLTARTVTMRMASLRLLEARLGTLHLITRAVVRRWRRTCLAASPRARCSG
jgi:hypothetical protein